MPRLRDHLRALAILLYLAAIVVLAIPNMGQALDKRAWQNPTVRDEIAAWSARLRRVGWQISPKELGDKAFAWASGWEPFRRKLVRPLRPLSRYGGVRQPWVMFVAPHRYPKRLEVAVEEEGAFRVVYSGRSRTETWNRHRFDHDRFRAATFRYGWPAYSGSYRAFAKWIAREAARDFPNAERVRIRFLGRASPTPAQVRSNEVPPEQPVDPHIISLGDFR